MHGKHSFNQIKGECICMGLCVCWFGCGIYRFQMRDVFRAVCSRINNEFTLFLCIFWIQRVLWI